MVIKKYLLENTIKCCLGKLGLNARLCPHVFYKKGYGTPSKAVNEKHLVFGGGEYVYHEYSTDIRERHVHKVFNSLDDFFEYYFSMQIELACTVNMAKRRDIAAELRKGNAEPFKEMRNKYLNQFNEIVDSHMRCTNYRLAKYLL